MLPILFYHVSFPFPYLLTYAFYPVVIAQISSPIAELVIAILVSSKETKAEMEIHPVIVEAKLRKCLI